MSMDRTAYGLSYMGIQALFIFFTTVILTFSYMLFYTNPTGAGGNAAIFFFGSLLLGLSMLAESMCISTLFSDSKLSTLMGLYVLLLPMSVFLYVVSVVLYVPPDSDDSSAYASPWFQLWYIFPNFSFGVIMIDFYIAGGAKSILGLNSWVAWLSLAVMPVLFFLLYMWLDATVPTSLGVKKDCFFWCPCKKTRSDGLTDSEALLAETEDDPLSPMASNQRGVTPSVIMKNLTKKFNRTVTAVDNLNLTVNKNEILCLLGHNGAGKTTAINLLTGMLRATSGDALVLGHSLQKETQDVRRQIGLC